MTKCSKCSGKTAWFALILRTLRLSGHFFGMVTVFEYVHKKLLILDDEGRRKRGKYDGPKPSDYDRICK